MQLLEVVRRSTQYLSERGSDSPRLDSELLAAHALGCERLDLYLQFDRPLNEAELTEIRELVRRRSKGEPVAYLTGTKEFYGRKFSVDSSVLIPRPETETLIARALAVITERHLHSAADLGTGSGCIAVTLAAENPDLTVTATDVSEESLTLAAGNAEAQGVAGRVQFLNCSWADAVTNQIDLVVSNPPYITAGEMKELARDVAEFEPHHALQGGDDGLEAYRELATSVAAHCGAARVLLLEIDFRRAEAVAAIVKSQWPDARVEIHPDLTGRDRVLEAELHG